MKFDIDCGKPGKALKHYWSTCVGGGRVGEALRADFQKHLEVTQREMPFGYIRMHGLFHEDMMVYREQDGKAIYNWQYVDLVFDHWLSVGIRPFVELGFMPYDMASGEATIFWWKGNITPPKDWARWEELVERFTSHVVERYGIDEVRRWYFEVWNEPNLKQFWFEANFPAYMELYERSVRAVKKVDAQLKVGGPASCGFAENPGVPPWGKEFLDECAKRKLPVDFFSTHPYPTMHVLDLEGTGYPIADGPERILVDLKGVKELVAASAYPDAEIHLTEWSCSPSPRDRSHDTAFMAPFIVMSNWTARGLADSLSFWVVSDIFEEGRQGDTAFHGGFGMINVQGLRKPSYHGYWFLSRLGSEELGGNEHYAVTRHSDGRITILAWNYCHYTKEGNDLRKLEQIVGTDMYKLYEAGSPQDFQFALKGLAGNVRVEVTRFDRSSGSVLDAWDAMGRPEHLLRQDVAALHQASQMPVTVTRQATKGGKLTLQATVEPHGVTMIEIAPDSRA